jgi:hypothetical protein
MSDEPENLDAVSAAARRGLPEIQDALGAGENRMTDQTDLSKSRFRKRYRQLSDTELKLNDAIKDKAAQLEALYDLLPSARYTSIAYTELETSVMYAVKQITGEPLARSKAEVEAVLENLNNITAD